MSRLQTPFTQAVGIEIPLICGAMYPCSNPELVAAASEAGGIGIVQPVSLKFAHGIDVRDGIRQIRSLTDKPIGFNALIEASSKVYLERMRAWVDIALEEDVRFFVTALGKPGWVVDKVHAVGGVVYHDITNRKWAEKALDEGVDGLICVNRRAGGHAGSDSPRALWDDLQSLGVPLICAGGIGDEQGFVDALDMGYAGVQVGTRFIATTECSAHQDYKQAIVDAQEDDIVLTERLTGVPVAIIKTPSVERMGTQAGPLARLLLKGNRSKHWVRTYFSIRSAFQLKSASKQGSSYKDYWQAGKSVGGIQQIEPVADIYKRFKVAALQEST